MRSRRPSYVVAGALVAAAVAGAAVWLAASSWFGGSSPAVTPAGANLWIDPDGGHCTRRASLTEYVDADACDSIDAAVALTSPGDVIRMKSGSYGNQVVGFAPQLRGVSPACDPLGTSGPPSTAGCVVIKPEPGGAVTIAGSLEIHASDVWVDGGQTRGGPYGFTVTGYTDTEADSSSVYPDHVVVSGVHSTSFGVFNADTVTFEDMDIGPSTISTNCQVLQGPGIENKIGSAGGILSPVPSNVTLDGMVIHDQNGDSGRIASDCHFGGLFLNTVNGLTVENSVFHGNVVYNVQIQNFGDVPAPTNVVFDHDSFGCPVTWLYEGAGCDGQSSIQFDGTFPDITIKNSAFAEPRPGYGCSVPPCDLAVDSFPGNTYGPTSTAAPAAR